jgi:hypothetical protein
MSKLMHASDIFRPEALENHRQRRRADRPTFTARGSGEWAWTIVVALTICAGGALALPVTVRLSGQAVEINRPHERDTVFEVRVDRLTAAAVPAPITLICDGHPQIRSSVTLGEGASPSTPLFLTVVPTREIGGPSEVVSARTCKAFVETGRRPAAGLLLDLSLRRGMR